MESAKYIKYMHDKGKEMEEGNDTIQAAGGRPTTTKEGEGGDESGRGDGVRDDADDAMERGAVEDDGPAARRKKEGRGRQRPEGKGKRKNGMGPWVKSEAKYYTSRQFVTGSLHCA